MIQVWRVRIDYNWKFIKRDTFLSVDHFIGEMIFTFQVIFIGCLHVKPISSLLGL